MHDWILGLRKAAIEHRGGVGASEWADAETELESVAPDELRELYLEVSGATFASGVMLFALTDASDPRGLVAQSQSGSAEFPTDDVWRFGRKGSQHLAAIRKARLGEIDQAEPAPMPEWLEDLPDDAWVYVAFDEENHELQVFRTLENLLSSLIPPAEAEELGGLTLTRARSLVEAAVTELGALGSAAVATIARVTKTRKRAKKKARPTAKKKAPPAKRKAAAPKKRAAPKRKPARKVSGTTSRRKTAKKKPTPKRR